METHMKKLTVPGIMIAELLMSPPAFAQFGSPSNASTPGASITKDDTWNVATRVKKHVASHKRKKHMAATASCQGLQANDGLWQLISTGSNHQ
jgi:hypothetical protein